MFTRVCTRQTKSRANLLCSRKAVLRSYSTKGGKNVAIVLSGCGARDGSEIHEAVSVLIHVDRNRSKYKIFAPNLPQTKVVSHQTGTDVHDEFRNILEESARIARGKISDLTYLNPSEFDALIFPGGFGAALNLSSFATDGAKMTIHPDVEAVISQFHALKKPIGLCCIAPVLAAKVIPDVKVTIGTDEGTSKAISELGATNVPKQSTEVFIDTKNLVVTTPAYMLDSRISEVYQGIGLMVDNVLQLCQQH